MPRKGKVGRVAWMGRPGAVLGQLKSVGTENVSRNTDRLNGGQRCALTTEIKDSGKREDWHVGWGKERKVDPSVTPDPLPPAGRWMWTKQLLHGGMETASYGEAEHKL